MKFVPFAAAIAMLGSPAFGQSLSVEELIAMVDKKVEALNPYQELLNDPDPQRSLYTMQIMMESGDKDLVRMAREFGLTSPNNAVRRLALEAYLKTKPILTFRLDGKDVKHKKFATYMASTFEASIDTSRVASIKVQIGNFDPETKCFGLAQWSYAKKCVITVNSDGVFIDWDRYGQWSGVAQEDGLIVGRATVGHFQEHMPFTARLLD